MEISSRRLEIVKERLEPEDEVQRSYTGRLDRRGGMLMASNRKLIFIEEKGFISKTHTVVLDMPYESVGEITAIDRNKLRLIDSEGGTHEFDSDVSAKLVDKALKELMEAAKRPQPVEA